VVRPEESGRGALRPRQPPGLVSVGSIGAEFRPRQPPGTITRQTSAREGRRFRRAGRVPARASKRGDDGVGGDQVLAFRT